MISKRTGNLRAVQTLLGHRRIESTFRYLGVEIDLPGFVYADLSVHQLADNPVSSIRLAASGDKSGSSAAVN